MVLKIRETIPLKEALDNLASIASIDLNAPGPIGIIHQSRIVTDPNEFPEPQVQWLSGEGSEVILEILDATFRSIHHYLQSLLGSDDQKKLDGIAAAMSLLGESAIRFEKYLGSRLGKPIGKISSRAEYLALEQFYQKHYAKKIAANEPHQAGETPLSDIDTVKRDRDYELFYIRHEDGTPFFKKDLVRHIRLDCNFDSLADTFEEDPLLQVRAMIDRDLQATAAQILRDCKSNLNELYRAIKKLKDNELASALSLASIALLLASNPRNLQQNTSGKSTQQYFEDFHKFLRRAMKTTEYQKWIAYPPEGSEKHARMLLDLTHSLCDSFFHRAGGVKQESIGLIHRTMRKGAAKQKGALKKGETLWTEFLYSDEQFRSLLAQFPNGPLFKTIDLLREEAEEDQIIPFDPIGQGNYPLKLFDFELDGRLLSLLRIPCPTRQMFIQKAELLDEFRGTLRSYQLAKPARKHLLINLQDRTGWKELSRSLAIDALQKNAEFHNVFMSVTLPKATPFYHQIEEFESMNQADTFFQTFIEQIQKGEGYSFTSLFTQTDLVDFAKKALPFIHRSFFDHKNSLTRRQREDFIEIFSLFATLKMIEKTEPDSISFTCKDALDTGAAMNASFFAFLKLLTADLSDKKIQDYFLWLLYTPALFTRERAIDSERFSRAISALEQIDSGLSHHRGDIEKEMNSLFGSKFLKALKVAI